MTNLLIFIIMKRFLLFLGLFITLSCSTTNAQLKYQNGILLFGNIETPSGEWCKTAWDGWGHYWGFRTNSGGYTWFKIVLGASNVRLSGNGGSIVFHDNSNFQDIYVKNVLNNSDLRVKTDISDISDATNTLLKLRPVSYRFIETETASQQKLSSNKETGFIAQEVEQVLPQAVTTDAEGNKLINYISIIPILTGSIKELNARIEKLETTLDAIKANR